MAKNAPKSISYGDHGFRAAFAGMDPAEIRRKLALRARASIRRATKSGISARVEPCDWPWLKGLPQQV
jgi:hypothetical protein